MEMRPLTRLIYLVSILLAGVSSDLFSEGTKELMPPPAFYTAGLYIINSSFGEYPAFAVPGCLPNYRLHIHVRTQGEEILFGLRSPTYPPNLQYVLRKPDGTVALTGSCPVSITQTGYIATYNQAVTGPFPALGGYNPLRYKVTSQADTGNYYFEVANLIQDYSCIFDLFDFQVVSGVHPVPEPADKINGRVWSQSWQVYTALQPGYVFNGAFFIYSDDGIVTKLSFSNARVGAATIFCNPFGCVNTGNFLTDRQSVNENTFLSYPGIADYRVFLNDPDSVLYPSGSFGQIIGLPEMIPDTAFPPCSGPQLIQVTVNKPGNIDLELTFPYGAPGTTVYLFSQVVPGVNQIPWNGLDGQGNPVPDGTPVTITATFADGLTNLPIWDQETNPTGFTITLVRPFNPSGQVVETFWDDTQLTPFSLCPVSPQTANLSGCVPGSIPGYPGCHPWGLNEPDCHNKMINTWWYGSSNAATATGIFPGPPAPPVGFGDTLCGPGIATLHATPPPGCTIDWYDTIAGGSPVLQGDTTFVTPWLEMTTTFYAESRHESSNCGSPVRTPVVATILPPPAPSIQGPGTACAGTAWHIYQTEEGNSNYKWWLSSGGVITSPNGTSLITVTWNDPGLHTVLVSYTDSTGCAAAEPGEFPVSVLPLPAAAGPVSGPDSICSGTDGLVYLVEPVLWAGSYTWSLPSGFVITSGAGTHTITVGLDPGAVSGVITVFGSNGCGEGPPSPPFPVTVVAPPAASAGPGDTLCEGTAYTVSGATAVNYSSLHWITNGNGELLDASSLTPTYIPDPDETGAVTMTLVAENPPCKSDSSPTILWIVAAGSVDAGPDLTGCQPHRVSMEGAVAAYYLNVHWTSSGTGSFSDPGQLHPDYFPSPEDWQSGFVALTLTITAFEPCSAVSDQRQLTFSPPPEGEAGSNARICTATSYQVTGAVANHFSFLEWTHDGAGLLTGASTLSPRYTPAGDETGTVTLTLTVAGEQACSDSILHDSMQLDIEGLSVDAGADQVVDSGKAASLAGVVEEGSGHYRVWWEPSTLVANPDQLATHTTPVQADKWFFLSVTDLVTGCNQTDSVWVRVTTYPPPEPECLEIYNVITPNGDGINDTWIITCIEQYPDNTVQILNRWGDRIRQFNRYDNAERVWDGTNARGEPIPDGTYYYILTIKDMEPITGWIFVRGGSQ